MSLTFTHTHDLSLSGTVSPPGSLPAPLDLPASGFTVDFSTAGDTPTPAPAEGFAATRDVWYRFTSDDFSTITFTWSGSFDIGWEMWALQVGAHPADSDTRTLVGYGHASTFPFPTGEDMEYLLRVHPMDTGDNSGSGTITYALAARAVSGILDLQCDDIAYDAPAWLRVSVLSCTELGDVEFEVDGVLVSTEQADESGMIVAQAILTGDLTAGTHTLLARDVESGREDDEDFEVLQATVEPDDDPPDDGPSAPVTPWRWVFEVTGDNARLYEFPNNPTDMTSPHADRVINPEHTTAPDGQPLLFEGEPVPVEWTATGVCFTQAHFVELELWLALNQRFYVIDHLERAWVVTLESIEWTELRDPTRPYAHRYSMKFYIYRGPVALP